MTDTMLDMEETQETPKLMDATDRCDQGCGARAFVMIETDSGTNLMFCGHHYNKFEASLIPIAQRIFDERE